MVKPGYKQTEIGAIPENWEVVTIGDVASFQGGSQPPIQHFAFQEQEGYIRLVQIRDYKTDKYLTYIPISLAKRFCTKDDIMIGRYGPPIFQILRGIEGSYNVALIKATPKDVDKEFLFYILKAEPLFEYIDLLSRRSSGQTGVDLDGLREYKIGLPPKSEQICIADALSNMDKLISVIEKQIAKKKGIKQGAMQDLLTGKKRLPGFSEKWESNKLHKCTERIIVGLATSVTQYYRERGTVIFRNLNILPNKLDDRDILYLDPDFANTYPNKKVKANDVLTVHTGYVGISCLVPPKYEGALTFTTLITTTKKDVLSPAFLVAHLNSPIGTKTIEALQAGGGRNNLNVSDFEQYELFFPQDVAEQEAIAEVLSNMDSEIEALEQKLAKYRQVKQGMMQQLLTGKIRLL